MKKLLFTVLALLFAQNMFACTAGFTHSFAPSGNNLLQVTFTNSSNPGIIPSGYTAIKICRFGDGTSSPSWNNGSTSHNYTTPGTYTATMIIEIVDSPAMTTIYCIDSITATVYVNYAPCGTSFTVSHGPNASATFTATNPAATSSMSYSWAYGDGNTGTGTPATHSYSADGSYNVVLTATSTLPCSYSDTQTVSINNLTPVVNCSSSSIAFTYSTNYSTVSFNPSITAPTSNVGLGHSNHYYYGDGTQGGGFHYYSSAGTYTASMVVTWYDTVNNVQTFACMDSIAQSVIVPAPLNQITGILNADTTVCYLPLPSFKVWLITYNASTQILAAVDSETVSSTGGFPTPYSFYNEAAGTYRVKSMITNGPTSGTGPLPTYAYDSLHWYGADSFVYSGSGISSAHDINFQCGTVTSGPGFIGGNVTLGANKSTKTTGGQAGVEILISSVLNGNIAYAMTDANGDFSFSNLPVASGGSTYTLYPEVLGYQNTPWSVTLYPGTDSVSSVAFHISTNHHTTTAGIGSVISREAKITVYPNPTTGIANVNSNVAAQVVISDVVGHKVFEAAINSGHTQLNLSNLKAGMYFISIKSANLSYSGKIVIQD